MKLLTKEILDRFAKVGRQEYKRDKKGEYTEEENPLDEHLVICKFFNAGGAWSWFCTEYDPVEKIFFWYVSIFGDYNDERGSFSLEGLESIKGQFGLWIERDMYFDEKPFSEVKKQFNY